MTEKIINGDYAFDDENKLKRVEYIDELLQNVVFTLSTQCGKFYPNKDFGSYIKENKEAPEDLCFLVYARQAIDDIDGVYIKSAKKNGKQVSFIILVNDEERVVNIDV